jgi:hypothetical protein
MAAALLMVLFFQNCGQPFTALEMSSNLSSSSVDDWMPTQDAFDKSAMTRDKAIGDATREKIIEFNLGTDVVGGQPISGVTLKIRVIKFVPTDGSQDTYFVYAPELKTGANSIEIRALRIRINGVDDHVSTTFTGINTTVPSNTTLKLSNATFIKQLGQAANASDTIGLAFDALWEQGATPVATPTPVGTPTPTPTPTLNGSTLYANNCASCHGSLAATSKQNRSAGEITTAISNVGQMNFLKNSLTAAQIDAIAKALQF